MLCAPQTLEQYVWLSLSYRIIQSEEHDQQVSRRLFISGSQTHHRRLRPDQIPLPAITNRRGAWGQLDGLMVEHNCWSSAGFELSEKETNSVREIETGKHSQASDRGSIGSHQSQGLHVMGDWYSVASLVRAILRNQRSIHPMSVFAKGFYGIEGD
ncbi:hypothetical protein QQ045_029676 [Rhodiola kirilowii]